MASVAITPEECQHEMKGWIGRQYSTRNVGGHLCWERHYDHSFVSEVSPVDLGKAPKIGC